MLEGHHDLNVISLQLKDLLAFIVVDSEGEVLLSLYLLLEEDIVSGGLHEGESEVWWKNDVHDVHLLDDNAVRVELSLQALLHLNSKFALNVSNSRNLDFAKETSDFFFSFFLEQLFESVWAKVVEEHLDVIFLLLGLVTCWVWICDSTNVEVDAHINADHDIVLGWDMMDWASESDCVLGDHDSDLPPVRVAASETWLHNTSIVTPGLFESVHSVWDVHLGLPARQTFVDNGHEWNALWMVLTHHSYCFLRVVDVQLDQMSHWSHDSLHLVAYLGILSLSYSVLLLAWLSPHCLIRFN